MIIYIDYLKERLNKMIIDSNVYSEVSAVLDSIGEEYTSKIPINFKKLIAKYKNNLYSVKYDFNRPLYEQNISKEALSIIALIHLNYWCKDENEKKGLYRLFQENEIKNENEKKLKYSPDHIFKTKKIKVGNDDIEENSGNTQMIVYKESVLHKCINFIKKIFNRHK